MNQPTPVFTAPGAGSWVLDRSHYDSGITPISGELMGTASRDAYRKLFETLGVPADTAMMAVVNGFAYTQIRPYFGADRDQTKAPPDALVRLIFKLHPEMRRREKRAVEAMKPDAFRTVLEDWHRRIRPRLVARNTELQSVDMSALDDTGLADHLDELLDHLFTNYEEHHRLHGYDLGPLGRLVVATAEHGIETTDALAALAGASPSTTEPQNHLAEIRALVEAAGVTPTSLDDVRAVSSEAEEKLDAYLARHGSVLCASYDLDGPTLGERPDLVLSALMTAKTHGSAADGHTNDAGAALLGQVPESARDEIAELLASARDAMDMRDDNGPITVEWPTGLLRLALLEAGGRLVANGRIDAAEHMFELDRREIRSLVVSQTGPSAAELRQRAATREANRSLDPPKMLGTEPIPPPLDLLPPAMGKAMKVTSGILHAMMPEPDPDQQSLTGVGIGTEVIEATARVAETAEEAIERLEPGDILVTRVTSPAFNLVLGIVSGLVTVAGGPMSHAAVLSRELGLSSVIGVVDCLDHVNDGDRLRLDPTAGTVEVVTADG